MKNPFKIALLGIMLFGLAMPADAGITSKKNAMPTDSFTIQPTSGIAVSLELAKKHLNIEADYTEDDVLLNTYIALGEGFVQGYTGRPLFGTMQYSAYGFEPFHFVGVPKILGTTISYLHLNDIGELESIDLPSENFAVLDLGNAKMLVNFTGTLPVPVLDNPAAVTVTFSFGPPPEMVGAVLLKVGESYAFRENRPVNGTNDAVYNLCRNYRINWS